MAKNQISVAAPRIRFTAGGAHNSGDFILQDGFHGVVVNTVANGEVGVLDTSQVEIEVALVSTAAKGDPIYITAAGALSKTSADNRLVGIVTAVASAEGVPANKMWMLVLPQNATIPS